MADDIPNWAWERAAELGKADHYNDAKALARYIADVAARLDDPFSGEAIAIGRDYWAKQFRDLMAPPVDPVEQVVSDLLPNAAEHPLRGIIRKAVERGMELAKEQPDGLPS